MSSEADSYELDIKNGKIAQGKEGGVYGAQGRDGLIIKQFKKNKSINKIRKEYGYQERAAAAGISPAVHSLDAKNKRIVMERLDRHLVQLCEDQNGELTLDQQKQIVDLYKRLGELGIYHNDSNPLNFMEKEGRMYLIDFGFSKDISKAKGDMGPNPNMVNTCFFCDAIFVLLA
jgi:tRNA A-37 threonylcarbamoyl transferase component Bud32